MFTRVCLAFGAILTAFAAYAAPMRYTVELTGFDFYTALGFPASGTIVFDLDFDFATNQTFTTDPRISLVSSTIPTASPLGFSYNPGADWLVVSGSDGGVTTPLGIADFYVSIFSVNDPTAASYFLEGAVTQPGQIVAAPYAGSFRREALGVVPLPATGVLLAGALGVLALRRRRQDAPHLATCGRR